VFEKGETLERVREAYLSFPQRFAPAEVYLIDATRSPEDVFTESRSFIEAAVARKWGRTSFR
jgi:thymidylate kinase